MKALASINRDRAVLEMIYDPRFEEAKTYLTDSINLLINLPEYQARAISYIYRARWYQNNGEISKADEDIKRSGEELDEGEKDHVQVAFARLSYFNSRAAIYAARRDKDQARDSATKALQESLRLGQEPERQVAEDILRRLD